MRNVCITDDILGFSQKLSAYPSTTTTLGKKIEGFERVFFFYVKLKNLSFKIIPDIIWWKCIEVVLLLYIIFDIVVLMVKDSI